MPTRTTLSQFRVVLRRVVDLRRILYLLVPMLGACATTSNVSDKVYLGEDVIHLLAPDVRKYTCGEHIMHCEVVTGGLSRACRCIRQQRGGLTL